ncbi:MAG: LysR family transcriptional regulator [Deltaproteobacteria bacterium]|nr:MAG: LysR family transcriptional regulator [Deltaproteobacteria bacterium]
MIPRKAVSCGWRWGRRRMIPLKLKSRQWLVDEQDRIIMGDGRREILENIERTGSINQTAKVMKMSYKAAWGKIKATEKYLDARIVYTDRKKGAWLTEEGKELLMKFRALQEGCREEEERLFRSIFGDDNVCCGDRIGD